MDVHDYPQKDRTKTGHKRIKTGRPLNVRCYVGFSNMPEKNRISETFHESTIFITGGTGSIGKVLIEKLLRTTEVSRIYLLIRNKKGKTPSQRLDELFDNKLFELLKKLKPRALQKCKLIYGDILQDDLGISQEDRQRLYEEVHFIYHLAANIRFDLSVKEAVKFNTRSTKVLLEMAQCFKKLKLFVHVSTAYAFPNEPALEEKAYEPPCDPHLVLQMLETATDEEIEGLLGDYPNTYTFSKALAEKLVVEQMDVIPVIITRPSIVCGILLEPVPGWCNNLQGPNGLFLAAGKGIMRSIYLNKNSHADIIPADLAVNYLLISTWNYINNSKNDRFINAVTTTASNYTWEQHIWNARDITCNEVPLNGVAWYPGGFVNSNKTFHLFCFYLFQIIPALLIDAILPIAGYKPFLYQLQRRIQKGTDVFEYYTLKNWNFINTLNDKLIKITTKKEQEVYKTDVADFDIRSYSKNCIYFVRKYYLKESDESLPDAKKHMKMLWIIDIVTKLLLVMTFFFYFYKWIIAPILY